MGGGGDDPGLLRALFVAWCDARPGAGVSAGAVLDPAHPIPAQARPLGLEACEVVKTEKGKILTDYPDHKIRFMAHDRAVALYGLTGKSMDQGVDPEASGPRVINVNVVYVEPPNRDPQPNIPEVKFLPPGPR